METPIRADQKVTGGSSNIPITRIGSAIIAHVRPDLFFLYQRQLIADRDMWDRDHITGVYGHETHGRGSPDVRPNSGLYS